MRILTDVNINWLRWRWHSLALSWLIILSGVGLMVTRGMPLGIDFTGGTMVILKFEKPVSEEAIRSLIPGDEEVVQQYGGPSDHEILIRLPQTKQAEQGFSLEREATELVSQLRSANLGNFEVLSTEVVGPTIGKDLQRKGIYATVASMLGIMSYIALRFRFSFGVGAMIATLHDVLITVSFLTFFGYELSLNVVAALLTLTGYGVNDQIVIFDRVRENMHKTRGMKMDDIVNLSVNQTLPRTIITAGTTALSVLALFLFGGEVLRGFAFTMLVGIITSTYSTVFIASAVAVLLSNWKSTKTKTQTTTAAAVKTTPERPAADASRGTKSKRKQAS